MHYKTLQFTITILFLSFPLNANATGQTSLHAVFSRVQSSNSVGKYERYALEKK